MALTPNVDHRSGAAIRADLVSRGEIVPNFWRNTAPPHGLEPIHLGDRPVLRLDRIGAQLGRARAIEFWATEYE